MDNSFQVTIGLEVHVHVDTESKLFCGCRNGFAGEPNTRICPVCSGQPGALPALNRKAVLQSVKAAVALGCRVKKESVFERKQYFYPDMSKNYQISQYAMPLGVEGSVETDERVVRVNRVHMEEDAGKLIHTEGATLVDLNRAGAALIEIVSEPDIKSPSEAGQYLRRLRQTLRYCGVSDCDMEQGSLRCDANISLNRPGDLCLGVKAEIKNLNSFRSVEKALEYEISRQERVLSGGGAVIQETRLWDEALQKTKSMRSKEEAHDYRYFPDPDLPPLVIEEETVEKIKAELPELPGPKRERFVSELGLSEYDAQVLSQEKETADYFEKTLETAGSENAKSAANWIAVELMARVNASGIEFPRQPVKPRSLGALIKLIQDGTVSGKMAKEVFEAVWDTGKEPSDIIQERGMKQITSETEIQQLCLEVINENSGAVQKFREGKEGVIGALVGGVMKKTKGQANPAIVNSVLRRLLSGR